jgi:hypothetical protein
VLSEIIILVAQQNIMEAQKKIKMKIACIVLPCVKMETGMD